MTRATTARAGLLLSVLLLLARSQSVRSHEEGGHHPPRALGDYIQRLESPERAAWQKPHEVVAALNIQPGAVIADIGAGSGYFTVLFARAVGSSGKVLAVDIEAGMLSHVKERAAAQELTNIDTVLATADDPLLPEKAIDTIFICDTIHHIADRGPYYSLLAKALKPGGRIAIIDFHKRELPVGPPPAMKLAREDALQEILESGYTLEAEHEFLPYQYFLIFSPKPNGAGR